MAIFPTIEIEGIVQVNDKTRIDCTKTFADKSENAITKVEIDPDGSGYVDVTGTSTSDWYMDWAYSTDGDKTVSCQVTTDGSPQSTTATQSVLSIADDKLFSDDEDLTLHEPDIRKWVPKGRNSFLNIHRRSQERILAWLDERGYTNSEGARLDKDNIVDIQEVREWSLFMTLKLIMQGISNALDDVFATKAKTYQKREDSARHRIKFRVDFDGDGTIDTGEMFNFSSIDLRRR